MYNLEVVTPGDGAEHFTYPNWDSLMGAVNSLQAVLEAGIVSDFTVWTDD